MYTTLPIFGEYRADEYYNTSMTTSALFDIATKLDKKEHSKTTSNGQ